MEIMSKMHMDLGPADIKVLGDMLQETNFKQLSKDKKWKMVHQYADDAEERNVVRCHTYHYIGRHYNDFPKDNAPDYEWQPKVEEIFTGLGLECPQEMIPKFVIALKRLTRQYLAQMHQEEASAFTMDALIEKAKHKLFGRCFPNQRDHAMLLIPHTVQEEMEHLKNSLKSKHSGELWRVQKLCGPNGYLDQLCKLNACDLMSMGEGEAHLDLKVRRGIQIGKNDKKIIQNPNDIALV